MRTAGLAWREHGETVALAGLGDVFARPTLNELMALGPAGWSEAIAAARAHDGPRLAGDVRDAPAVRRRRLRRLLRVARARVEPRAGCSVPTQEPLLPNWRWLPVGYHGRAGTVAVSGTDVVRPRGQLKLGDADPVYEPTRKLDVELELGFVVGVPRSEAPCRPPRSPTTSSASSSSNDWSARDIQAWEYVPLGPFLGKSFQTSISAWVTPLALLEPRRVEAPAQDPPPLPHLAGGRDWALDVDLEIELNGEVVSRGNARTLYWTMPQMLAHATSNGATIRTGDLMATGTISGAEPGSEGSLIELYGNTRFLADGDEVVLRGRAGDVELGEVRGRVVPSAPAG